MNPKIVFDGKYYSFIHNGVKRMALTRGNAQTLLTATLFPVSIHNRPVKTGTGATQ